MLTLAEAIGRLTTGPASVLDLERGRLSVGSVADVCIFDPQITWTMQESDVVSRGHNTPFLGWRFKGRVTRDNWVEQARTLAAGGETEFSKRAKY